MQEKSEKVNKKKLTLAEYVAEYGVMIMHLAGKLGVSNSHMSALISGKDMYLSTALQLVNATDGRVSIESLIRGMTTTKKQRKSGYRKIRRAPVQGEST